MQIDRPFASEKTDQIAPLTSHRLHWHGNLAEFDGKNHFFGQSQTLMSNFMTNPLRRSDQEEFWNCLTHAVGFALAILGAILLIPRYQDQPIPIWLSVFAFALALIVVYGCSALSHYFQDPARLTLFRKLDQAWDLYPDCGFLLAIFPPIPARFVVAPGVRFDVDSGRDRFRVQTGLFASR